MKTTKKRTQIRQESPHNNRIFSVREFLLNKTFIWSFLLLLISVNVFAKITSETNVTINQILLHPQSPNPHIILADILWKNKQFGFAKREIEVAIDLSKTTPHASVLGETTDHVLDRWGAEQQLLLKAYDYWLGVVHEKPDYRDAYIALGTIAYDLDKTEDARLFFQQAREIDPNITISEEIESNLKI